MHIAVLGAGFTGLVAALRLGQKGHEVTIFEKEETVGGLAVGFKEENWGWTVEKAYHHWFTNDTYALSLARELRFPVVTKRPSTDVFIDGQRFPFDSPVSLLTFPKLSFASRLQTGIAAAYLKFTNDYKTFEGRKATVWIKKWMGEESFAKIWDPLFTGKFGEYKNNIALTWFWARIKKRTPSLAYPEGGFQNFANRIGDEIKRLGGKIHVATEVVRVTKNGKHVDVSIRTTNSELRTQNYDSVIVTLPTPIFVKLIDGLPRDYVKKISSINYLHALNLMLILDKPFMEKTYWLNITDKSFPFLVVVEHTNFMDPKYYGGKHIVYVGNYLPKDHRYFKMTEDELLKEFTPYLKKINSEFLILNSKLFVGPFAQPVVTVDYPKHIPTIETPIKNVYLANLSMVYPWDRGTNYAIELGEKVAKRVMSS